MTESMTKAIGLLMISVGLIGMLRLLEAEDPEAVVIRRAVWDLAFVTMCLVAVGMALDLLAGC